MAESFNGVYGILLDIQENMNTYSSDDIRKEILFCAYISQKEIFRRIEVYNWNEMTPINVPLISDQTINLKIALKKTVGTLQNMATELGIEAEINEIFSEGDLFTDLNNVKA